MISTIYALSSGSPPAAVAIVRLSGPRAGAALARLAGRLPVPRRATVTTLHEGDEPLDRALVLFFPGPASATGEDLAELHLHGGRAVVARVLDALSRLEGLAPAEPGAFTRRAFENGRIDLAEAEGLNDLLFAETEGQRRNALRVAGGALGIRVADWQERLLALSARVEALLDFSDEDDVAADAALGEDVAALADEMRSMLATPPAERLRDGVRVALAGPPNAGKSTLLNALSGRSAALVSPIAGTTRDLIEVPLAIAGRPYVVIDTAGLHGSTDDPLEQAGIDRAHAAIEQSDVVLWIDDDDAGAPADAIHVYPRIDLAGRGPPAGALPVSAVTGEGMDRLIARLVERADALLPGIGEVALNRRQRQCLFDALEALTIDRDPLIMAEHLRLARAAFDRLTGRSGAEDMLDALFGRFCIGK